MSCSTSLRDLVSAVAGVPSSSSTISSILRPADLAADLVEVELGAVDHVLADLGEGPVSGARKPILIGAPWARGGGGADERHDEGGEQDEGQDASA